MGLVCSGALSSARQESRPTVWLNGGASLSPSFPAACFPSLAGADPGAHLPQALRTVTWDSPVKVRDSESSSTNLFLKTPTLLNYCNNCVAIYAVWGCPPRAEGQQLISCPLPLREIWATCRCSSEPPALGARPPSAHLYSCPGARSLPEARVRMLPRSQITPQQYSL